MAKRNSKTPPRTESYDHPKAEALLRPDVGTQAQFKKKKPPAKWRYDSSIAPALDWDGGNASRELGEWLLAAIDEAAALQAPHEFAAPRVFKDARGEELANLGGLRDAVEQLRRLGRPFLNWAGKAERISFDVPTLPLFVHERLSTKAILETLKSHRRDQSKPAYTLFGDPELPVRDQVLRAYEYPSKWTNRIILGDSLVVMNSLLKYEGLGEKVQMIYMDPPYGVKFGSNFQPFVRRRDVKNNDDDEMTREPEMVKAYRDTWELGLHSYLTYMRDRLFLAKEMLTPSGSIFVQISDENLHHVKELLDETFGEDNTCAIISFAKTTSPATRLLSQEFDYLLWYARDKKAVKYRQMFLNKSVRMFASYKYAESPDGATIRALTKEEKLDPALLCPGWKVLQLSNLASQDPGPADQRTYSFGGRPYDCGAGRHWKTRNPEGLNRLGAAERIVPLASQLNFKRYLADFPFVAASNLWDDTGSAGFSVADPKLYVVQTDSETIKRCVLMSTDPGDLVLDPTCGGGTTAYVAEQWGRRWITIDTSRVPLALTRQRLLTATYPYYRLKDEELGPAGGFVYLRKQNSRGEDVGGIVPHVTLKSIANDEPPDDEILVDRPEVDSKIVRVSGPICVEATIPTPVDWDGDGEEDTGSGENYGSFVDRMVEVLRKSPVIHLDGGKTVALKSIRPPAKTLSLSAEAVVANGNEKPVAIIFGPENGAVSEKLVWEAAREAYAKSYAHLYVIGFAIQPNARALVEDCDKVVSIPATYVQATPDLMMGDLLKHMRSSQIFSVCGLPEIKVTRVPAKKKDGDSRYQVELTGLDVFDPITMEVAHDKGQDVPAWFLDTDYNELSFKVSQAFFPRTAAWDDLKRALRGEYEESVWEHLAGTTSAPFEAGEHGKIAVKVIDDRGNELLIVKSLEQVEK